jgi:PAS domain S-box-containing protein
MDREVADSVNDRVRKLLQETSSYRTELDQTRAYLQCILQNSTEMIFATDVDGILVSFSRGGEKVLGYSWEEVTGRMVSDLAVDPASLRELMLESQVRKGASKMDFSFRHKNGTLVSCNISLLSLSNRSGERVGTVGICRDMTEWKKIQEGLRRSERLAEIGKLASGIAHEINNPLAIIHEISGWAETTVSDSTDIAEGLRAELRKALADIEEQTKRCRAITHQLLGFVRETYPPLAEVDLRDLISKALGFLRTEISRAGIDLFTDFSDGELIVRSDARMLEQVLVNLLSNAIDAIAEKGTGDGRIDVMVRRVESGLEIAVRDNGKGIPEDHRQKVFDLLFTTKPAGKGTGLGLPICQNIMERLSGEIRFVSEEQVGTTFMVTLPA